MDSGDFFVHEGPRLSGVGGEPSLEESPECQRVSEAAREATESLIRSVGLSAKVFASAEDFLHSGHLQDTACLIVDVRMPRMNGLEFQRQLATSLCPIPLIFITAHGDAEGRARALSTGAVAFLDKPFGDEVLLRAVQSALLSFRGAGEGASVTIQRHGTIPGSKRALQSE
jgi:FixJ family two-component response regulator